MTDHHPVTRLVSADWVQEQLLAIAGLAAQGDDEAAHSAEDGMRARVLEAISTGLAPSAEHLARLALVSRRIDFERHCA